MREREKTDRGAGMSRWKIVRACAAALGFHEWLPVDEG